MKQRKPLAPGKPLQRRTGLRTTTGMTRSTRLASRGPVKTRRAPALNAAERAVRDMVIARSGGRCELCGLKPGTDFSHRWRDGQSGPYVASNGLWADRQCHDAAHLYPAAAKAHGWFIAPRWELVDGRRVPVATSRVPVFVWRRNGWGPEWVWLDDLGGLRPVGYDELDAVLKEHGLERFS